MNKSEMDQIVAEVDAVIETATFESAHAIFPQARAWHAMQDSWRFNVIVASDPDLPEQTIMDGAAAKGMTMLHLTPEQLGRIAKRIGVIGEVVCPR